MTSVIPGAPDFQRQASATVSSLVHAVINTVGPQLVDLSALIQPHHQALAVYWIAAGASAGQACNIEVQGSILPVEIQLPTLCLSQQAVYVRVQGNLIIAGVGTPLSLIVTPIPGDPTPITGDIFVMGLTETDASIPSQHKANIGDARTSGGITVLAGATTTILAAPPTGVYNRLRTLSWRSNSNAIAGAPVVWSFGAGGQFLVTEAADNFRAYDTTTVDLSTTDSVTLTNSLTGNIVGAVSFERYPI